MTEQNKVTDSNFESLAKTRSAFLFVSDKSGHSKLMQERLANVEGQKYIVDVADCLAVCAKYGIKSVPTLAVFEDNAPVVIRKGLLTEEDLQRIVAKN